ncbi:accessory factor UbiK family protein [Salmonella enterica subsp. salamae]|nr:accessory factor UbiK family protein [Salmonella enterica subsp. salamae]
MINLTNKKQAWIDELFLAPMTALNKQAGAGDVNPKTYYIHPAAFGSTKDPGYGHVPVVKADDFENLRAKLEAAEKRIAELEARTITVKFEPIPMEELGNRRDGKKHPYMFGAGYNSAVVHCESVLHQACAAAGIGVKGE